MLETRKQAALKRENHRVRRGISRLPILLLFFLIPLVATAIPLGEGQAPQIVVEPAETHGVARDVIVRARIVDPDGVGSVTVWARGEKESEFAGYPMKSAGAGEWSGRIPPIPTRGRSVAYFIEAMDRLGNGPARDGSPESPHLVSLAALPPAALPQTATLGWGWFDWTLIAIFIVVAVFLFGVFLSFRRRRHDRSELDFWCNLLSPLSDKTGSELSRRIDRLCDTYHDHPTLGRVRLQREEILLWLGTIRRCEPERLRLMRRIHRERGESGPRPETGARTATHREVAEDSFWYEMLAPLLELSRAETAEAIRELSGRPHVHPTHGIITPDVKALRERLRRVAQARSSEAIAHSGLDATDAARRIVPQQIVARQAASTDGRPAPGKSAGASLPEMIVVIAIVGLVAGAAMLYLRPMEAPVRSAAMLVEGLVKQTRAKSMSTTSSYRMRPFTDNQLVVEYATSCSEEAWTLDPRMDLDLPTGVTLSATNWSVCFNSRGTASDNVVVVLNHPDHEAQHLEILMGGAVRWDER